MGIQLRPQLRHNDKQQSARTFRRQPSALREGLKFGTEHFPTQTQWWTPDWLILSLQDRRLSRAMRRPADTSTPKGRNYSSYADAGDVKFVDVNGDGVINDADKVNVAQYSQAEVELQLQRRMQLLDLFACLAAHGAAVLQRQQILLREHERRLQLPDFHLDAWTSTNTATSLQSPSHLQRPQRQPQR